MTEYNIFYYPYTSLTNKHALLLKIAALYFDKVSASWALADGSAWCVG